MSKRVRREEKERVPYGRKRCSHEGCETILPSDCPFLMCGEHVSKEALWDAIVRIHQSVDDLQPKWP